MFKSSTPYLLASLVALCSVTDVFAASFDSADDIFNSAPTAMLHQLESKKNSAKGQMELNQYFASKVINQHAKFHAKVDFAEATPQGKNKFRIRAVSEPISWKGGTLNRLVWFYFPAATVPKEGQVAVGSEIVVSGIIGRCEIVTTGGALQMNVDFGESKLEEPANPPR